MIVTVSPNPAGRPVTQPCGTVAGWSRHLRRSEPVCDECRDARNDYQRARARRVSDPTDSVPVPPPPGPWVEDAACRGLDTNQWFPTRGEPLDAARAICADCPVAADCLEYAVVNCIRHGVWGGTSERDRRKMRRDRGIGRTSPVQREGRSAVCRSCGSAFLAGSRGPLPVGCPSCREAS